MTPHLRSAGFVPAGYSARLIWNGVLVTMPMTIDANRLSFRPASRTMERNHGHIVVLHPSTQGVGQELLGEIREKCIRIVQKRLPKAGRAVHFCPINQFAGRDDRETTVPGAPCSDSVKVLQRQADPVDDPVTGSAWFDRAVPLHPVAHGSKLACLTAKDIVFFQEWHVRRWDRSSHP